METLESRARKLDEKIDQLKRKIDGASQKVKDHFTDARRDLEARRERIHLRLSNLKAASRAARDEMSEGLESALEELSQAYDRAAERFKTQSAAEKEHPVGAGGQNPKS